MDPITNVEDTSQLISLFTGNTTNTLIAAGITLVIAVVLFFLFRGIYCWYYKINARLRVMEDMAEDIHACRKHLSRLASTMEKQQGIND